MNSMEDPLTPRLRVMQIITVALVLGVAVFLGIVLYLVQVQNQGRGTMTPPPDLPVLSLMAAGFLAVLTVASFLVPAGVVRKSLRGITDTNWEPDLGVYQVALIVGLAMLEGACFFNCIAYLLEAQPYTLGCIGIGLLLMLARFPTESRVRLWRDNQKERLAQAPREMGSGGQLR
jgi:hypothetical protein